MKVLVVGGAGYIGSHVVKKLAKMGHDVVIFDNLSGGHASSIGKTSFIFGDLSDFKSIDNAIKASGADSIVHLAGFIEAGESMLDPGRFYFNNVANSINLLNSMVRNRVLRLVYSSSAAVYGFPKSIPIKEDHPLSPSSAYGETKLVIERALKWFDSAYGLKYVSLRYFNAAGAGLNGELPERHEPETHLIPNVLRSAIQGVPIKIFGSDYPTPDGTCIRDYIHVLDLASAHVAGLEWLENESGIFNVGTGKGYSVLELVDKIGRVSGIDISRIYSGRRHGDPGILVAECSKIRSILGWKPQYEIKDIISTAWKAEAR